MPLQTLGIAIMVLGVTSFAISLAVTIKDQVASGRVNPVHARFRLTTFAIVFFGGALVMLGTPLSPVFGLSLVGLSVMTLVFAFSIQFR